MNNKQLYLYSTLLNKYMDGSVCMAEFLASEPIPEGPITYTFEDIFEIYIRLMKDINGDRFYTIKEGELIEL